MKVATSKDVIAAEKLLDGTITVSNDRYLYVGKMLSAQEIKELYPQQHKYPLNSKE